MLARMDWRLTTFAVMALCGAGSGCSLFQPKVAPELTAQVTPNGIEDGKLEPPPGNFTVEVQPAKGKPTAKEQPLAGHLTVQEALEHTKANKKFRKFKLELYRPLPDGRTHSMVLQYDRKNKCVDPEYDYAIQAGDRLVVVEDTSTVLDEMLDAMSVPFGGPSRFTGKEKRGVHYRTEG
jgi:hypothetical protein